MENAKKQLFNGTMIYFVGNALTQLVSLLLLRFVTGKIDADEYGYYNLIVTITNLVVPILTVQISDAVFRFLLKAKEERQRKAIYTDAAIIIACGLIAIVLLVLIIDIFFYRIEHAVLVALYVICSNLFSFYQKIARGLGRNKQYVYSNLLKTVLYIVLQMVFIFIFDLGVESLFLSMIIATMISVVMIEISTQSRKMFSLQCFDKALLKKMLRFSIPLIPNTALWWLTSSINALIVTMKLGLDINGIYMVANKFSNILTVITSVFIMAWQESAIKEYDNVGFKRFQTETFSFYSVAIGSAIAVIIPAMRVVIPFLVAESYHSAIRYAPFLLVATGLAALSSYAAQVITAQGNTKRIMSTTVIGVVLNIAVVFLLIDAIGLWAAVCGTIAANFGMMVVRLIMIRNEFSDGILSWRLIVTMFSVIVSVVVYALADYTVNIILFVLTFVLMLLINMNVVRSIFLMAKGRLSK